MKYILTPILFIFITISLCAETESELVATATFQSPYDGQYHEGKRYQAGWLSIVSLSGDYYSMGQQYGQLMQQEIHAAYQYMIQETFIDNDILSFDILKKELFEKGWSAISSRQKKIFQGMANTSGLPLDKLFILDQAMYAFVLARVLNGESGLHRAVPECSFIATWLLSTKNYSMIIGRNLDWFASYINYAPLLTLVVYNPNDGSQSVANLAYAGVVNTLTGFNNAGQFLELNSALGVLGDTFYENRSRYLNQLLEILFDSDSFDALKRRITMSRPEFANIINAASVKDGIFYEGSISFENAPQAVLTRKGDLGLLVATNLYLNEQWGIEVFEQPTFPLARMNNLEKLAYSLIGKIDLEVMKYIMEQPLQINGTLANGATMYEFPDKNHHELTVYTVVANLNEKILWVRVPGKTPWQQVNYSYFFINN